MGRVNDLIIERSETVIIDPCSECEGEGVITYEIIRPQGFTRDIGYIDTDEEECTHCAGLGKIDRLCIHCNEPITFGSKGRNSFVCEECSS